jgi:signal transduction histidine kinase
MLTIQDVTEDKAASQRLAELQESAERGRMLSSISHELNNHLALLAGGLELANHASSVGDLSKTREHIGRLQGTYDSIVQFANELVGRKKDKSCKSPCDLNSVVKRCVTFAKLQDSFRGIELQLELSDGLARMYMDEDEIGQLLLNVVNNAADAIKSINDTGVIRVRTYSCEDHICLEVMDNGPGIQPEIKGRLFKENLTTKETGHGFGLTVSAQILQNHNAQHHIESELGKGAVFRFSFPTGLR